MKAYQLKQIMNELPQELKNRLRTQPPMLPEDEVNWLDDRVGRDKEGRLVLKLAGNTIAICDQDALWAARDTAERLKWEIEDAQRRINAREPKEWIPKAITQLNERAVVSEKAMLELDAGYSKSPLIKNLLMGQTQAYRDSAAMLSAYLPSP